uniref:Uncharacterized protein n=1 Tax=Arundo donax TaxID=35708 RepID=A0A0A9DUP8_ARUDO
MLRALLPTLQFFQWLLDCKVYP